METNTRKYDHKEIIKLWLKKTPQHPSFGSVAKEIGCSKALVVKVIANYQQNVKDP